MITNVRDLKSYELFSADLNSKIGPKIKNALLKSIEKMPKSFAIMNGIPYKIFLCIFAITIIPVIVHLILRNSQKKLLLKYIEKKEIFKSVFEQLPYLKYENSESDSNTNDLLQNAPKHVPSNAFVIESSDIFTFKLLDKYFCTMRTGRLKWIIYDNEANKKSVYYCNVCYITFSVNDKKSIDFNYKLMSKRKLISLKKRTNLESEEFNKKLNFVTNDEVKARMMYSPLAMESTLKIVDSLKLRDKYQLKQWNIEKKGPNFKIIFQPVRTWNILDIDLVYSNNSGKMENAIIDKLINGSYFTYKLFGLVLIPILI